MNNTSKMVIGSRLGTLTFALVMKTDLTWLSLVNIYYWFDHQKKNILSGGFFTRVCYCTVPSDRLDECIKIVNCTFQSLCTWGVTWRMIVHDDSDNVFIIILNIGIKNM